MPRYRVEVVWVCRNWTELVVEADSRDEAHSAVLEMDDLTPEHLDTDPDIEINVIGEAAFAPVAPPWPE